MKGESRVEGRAESQRKQRSQILQFLERFIELHLVQRQAKVRGQLAHLFSVKSAAPVCRVSVLG